MPTDRHLTLEELALLAEGRGGEIDAECAHHVERCPECLAAYSEAVMSSGEFFQDPGRFALPDSLHGRFVEVGGGPSRDAPRGRRWFAAASLAGLASAFAVVVWFGSRDRDAPKGTFEPPASVAALVDQYSAAGFPLPGARDVRGETPVYRTHDPVGEGDVAAELRELDRQYAEQATATLAAWRVAGYLALGDARTARAVLVEGRARFPRSADLLVLAAALAYRNGDHDRAREHIDSALGLEAGHEAAVAARRLLTE